jgi:hypothetical protein
MPVSINFNRSRVFEILKLPVSWDLKSKDNIGNLALGLNFWFCGGFIFSGFC